jgi:hypothetical protein
VILVVEDFEGSAALVAVNVTDGGEGKLCGAVKTPPELTAPHAAPEHPAPPTLHKTALAGLPAEVIVAGKLSWAPNSTAKVPGAIVTATSLVIVMFTVAVRVGSAELVARIATIAGNGMNWGAVKIAPLLVVLTIVPTVVFPPGTFCTLQLTAIFAAFDTVAVSVVDLPSNTDGLSAVSATETFDGDGSVVVEDDPAAPPHPETPRPTIVVAKYPATIAFCLQFVVLAFRFSQDIPRDKARTMP